MAGLEQTGSLVKGVSETITWQPDRKKNYSRKSAGRGDYKAVNALVAHRVRNLGIWGCSKENLCSLKPLREATERTKRWEDVGA